MVYTFCRSESVYKRSGLPLQRSWRGMWFHVKLGRFVSLVWQICQVQWWARDWLLTKCRRTFCSFPLNTFCLLSILKEVSACFGWAHLEYEDCSEIVVSNPEWKFAGASWLSTARTHYHGNISSRRLFSVLHIPACGCFNTASEPKRQGSRYAISALFPCARTRYLMMKWEGSRD